MWLDRIVMARRFWHRFSAADPGLMAAAVAFNTFFALVPAALGLATVASLIGRDQEAVRRTRTTLEAVVPPDVAEFFVDTLLDVNDLVAGQRGLIVVVSMVIALWSGSRGVRALQRALGNVEHLSERRWGPRVRLIGIGLTLLGATAFILVSYLMVAGTTAVDFLIELTGFEAFRIASVLVGLPAAAFGLFLFLYAVYRWGPPQSVPRPAVSAAVATFGVGVLSAGFGFYLATFPIGSTFGVLGTVAVSLLWLYLTVYVVLLTAAGVGFASRYFGGEEWSETEPLVPQS